MAFSTEFVMGAGGAEVEEIPVSFSGGGGTSAFPTTHPGATVDAGDGAFVVLVGTMTPGSTGGTGRPHLRLAGGLHEGPHLLLAGPNGPGIGALATGIVQIELLSRTTTVTTFVGTVYVTRM